MSKFIKFPGEESDIDKSALLKAFEDARKLGDAFILIYRDKVNKKYFTHDSGYTRTERLFAAEMLRDLAMYGDDDDGGVK